MFEVFKKSFSVTVGVLSGIIVIGGIMNLIDIANQDTTKQVENKSSEKVETL